MITYKIINFLGNILHACGIKYSTSTSQALAYAVCLMRAPGSGAAVRFIYIFVLFAHDCHFFKLCNSALLWLALTLHLWRLVLKVWKARICTRSMVMRR